MAYLSGSEGRSVKNCRDSNQAAMVIAAGSVMSDPSKGAKVSKVNQWAAGEPPNSRAAAPKARPARFTMGRAEARAMMMKTNKGSTNFEGAAAAVPSANA